MTDKEILNQIRLEQDICKTQADFYKKAAVDGCDMKTFSNRYLKSNFCNKSMETTYSSFQREDAETCLEFIYPQIGNPEDIPYDPSGKKIFDPDVAYWVGYTYQQLYYETGMRGAQLAEQVPFDKLILNYRAHHTLDETHSTDKLCEYYGLKKNNMHLAYARRGEPSLI